MPHYPVPCERKLTAFQGFAIDAMAGAPFGNQNAVKAKRWQQAIDRALERRCKADGIAELDRLADVYLDTIEDMTTGTEKRGPSIAGFVDLADRLDGKPTQTIAGDNDSPFVVQVIRYGAADPTP